jgi:hypothetical protein
MEASDAEVLEAQTSGGATVADHFLIEGFPHAVNPRGELMALLIEDEDVAEATVEYLRRLGAPEYGSFEAYQEHRQRSTSSPPAV